MTVQEIAQALQNLIREDSKQPPEEQVRDLIEAGVIDEQGRVLIGGWDKKKLEEKTGQQNSSNALPSPNRVAGS